MSRTSKAVPNQPNDLARLEQGVRFGIGKRLISAFVFVTVLSLLIVAVSWFGFNRLMSTQEKMTAYDVPAMSAALGLATQTNQLLTVAPLMAQATTSTERTDHASTVTLSLQGLDTQIKAIAPLINKPEIIDEFNRVYQDLSPLFQQLEALTQQRIVSTLRREELAKIVTDYRSLADTTLRPYTAQIKFRYMEISDQWLEVVEDLSTAPPFDGQTPDTTDLELAPLQIANFQNSILEFKNGANLLIGILLQASQTEDAAVLRTLQETFMQSIASLATPLSVIHQDDGTVQSLDDMFQSLLKIGVNGALNDNIFLLRLNELEIEQQSQTTLNQISEIVNSLSTEVTFLVDDLSFAMDEMAQTNEQANGYLTGALFAAAALTVLGAIGVGYFYIHRNLIARLMQLVATMKAIAEGNLKIRVNRNGGDEISLMGGTLAILRNGLRETEALKIQQEQDRTKAETDKKHHAATLANEFDQAVGRSLKTLSSSLGDIRSKATSMHEIAAHAMSETETVRDASQNMAQDISSVASSSEQLSASIREISEQVANSTTVSAEAVQRAETLSGNITQLQSGSTEIESVIALINTIAEQTNLLALNATIEAARAGEAGKGFAVVAGEVKNLANQTTRATEDIAKLIGAIQQEISQAVTANTQITSIISEIDHVSSGIAAAVEEQSAATREISTTVQNASDNVADISQRVQDVTDAVSNNNDVIDQVLQGVSTIDDQSTTLNTEVNHFLSTLKAE